MILSVFTLVLTVPPSLSVLFPKNRFFNTGEDNLGECLRESDEILPCLTESGVRQLQDANDVKLTLGEGVFLVDDDAGNEKIVKGDPREPSTFLSALDLYMRRRRLLWDLNEFFPGLVMQIGPESDGLLQFRLNRRQSVDERHLSPGMLIMKRTLLPILLGVKLNVVSFAPLIIGLLVVLAKKALLLSKFSVLLTLYTIFRHRRPPLVTGGGGEGLIDPNDGESLSSFASLPQNRQ